jgi:hypothetical protein
VLKWEKNALPGFGLEKRKDQELYDLLIARGAAKENLMLLTDEKATLQAIRDAVRDTARKCPKGSTFLFYFAGHGGRASGKVGLCNYDLAGKNFATDSFQVSELAQILKKEFSGDRVMFFADCCHSGGLAQAAKELAGKGIAALSLTSADEPSISSGTWIYSMTLLDALRGDLLDHDGDGQLSLGEMSREIADAMKYRERQRFGFYASGFDSSFRFGPAKKPAMLEGAFALNQFVSAPDGRRVQVGRIVGQEKARYRVQFHDYADRRIVLVGKEQIAPVKFAHHKEGEKIHVLYGAGVFAAKVLSLDGDFHLIRYDGYGEEWDEWVLSPRIVPKPDGPMRIVQVEWNGQWFPAIILKSEKKRFYIHYIGFESSWDEWVTPERLRIPPDTSIVFVRTAESWFPAVIQKIDGEKRLVRYHGCTPESDEWVTADQVRVLDQRKERPALVARKGGWVAAIVQKSDGKRFHIHYVGEKPDADEWVNADRVKLLEQRKETPSEPRTK